MLTLELKMNTIKLFFTTTKNCIVHGRRRKISTEYDINGYFKIKILYQHDHCYEEKS